MTIPNVLTLVRIFLTPVLVWFLLDGRLTSALIVFFIAGMTDALDGLIARVFHQQSRFGAYIDPLADKILLVTSFVILGYIGLVPTWLAIIAVSRDLMILTGTFHPDVPPGKGGNKALRFEQAYHAFSAHNHLHDARFLPASPAFLGLHDSVPCYGGVLCVQRRQLSPRRAWPSRAAAHKRRGRIMFFLT